MKAMNQAESDRGSNPSPSAIVAFLRDVNVGGHKKIAMAALERSVGQEVTTRNWQTMTKRAGSRT